MQNRKQTAWRKSRKFGDRYGGRQRLKLADNIFKREHSLSPPAPGQETPILIEDNPSRDFFFPLSGQAILATLHQLPKEHTSGITHIWLRRIKRSDYEVRKQPLACFICGSGVRLIVLYPWPQDRILRFEQGRTKAQLLREYGRWTTDLFQENGRWCLRWTLESLREFTIFLLLHEVGHHVDWYTRHWSKANRKQVEEFAERYAVEWSAVATQLTEM